MHFLERSQYLPISLEKAWDFFATPDNLSKITPENMSFEIVKKTSKGKIANNDIIDYKVKPMGNLPFKWKTLITKVEEPHCFVDKQLKGPYKIWEHTHTFTKAQNGVLMQDRVKYKLPLGIFGILFHPLVRKRLEFIFDYRYNKLNQLVENGTLS